MTTIAMKDALGRVGGMRWKQAKRWLVTGLALVLGVAPEAMAEGLPSRLKVGVPAFDGGKVKLGWEVPGSGWTFRVEESAAVGGSWVLASGGEVGTARTWTDASDAADAGRVFRVVATPPAVVRGKLVSATKTATYTTASLTFLFAFAGIPLTPQHNVDVYKVVYDTVDPWGLPTRASAAVAVPATAIYYQAYGDSIFVAVEKKDEKTGETVKRAEQRFVRLGETRGDFVAIESGVQAGEEVVTTGAFKLSNGTKLVIDNSLAPQPQLAPKPANT